MQSLLKALTKARPNFSPIEKDKSLPNRGKYASLDSVLSAVTPALTANGLHIVQLVQEQHLYTYLYHESGEHLESKYPLPQAHKPQDLGAAITYARRYALCAMLSVTADEDVDGGGRPAAASEAARQIVSEAIEAGIPKASIIEACRRRNIPIQSGDYRTDAQVNALREIIERLAEVEAAQSV